MPFDAKPWTRHSKGLNAQGESVCKRCGASLFYTIPVERIVCTKEDRAYLGDIESAVDCHAV